MNGFQDTFHSKQERVESLPKLIFPLFDVHQVFLFSKTNSLGLSSSLHVKVGVDTSERSDTRGLGGRS